MITIEINNPEVEATYTKEEIKEEIDNFLMNIKPKRRKKAGKITIYSLNLEDAPKKVQESFIEKDNEQYISFKKL